MMNMNNIPHKQMREMMKVKIQVRMVAAMAKVKVV